MPFLRKIRLLLASMGPAWLLFRTWHAIKLASGYLRCRFPATMWGPPAEWRDQRLGNFFPLPAPEELQAASPNSQVQQHADGVANGRFVMFGHRGKELGFPPDWFRNPLSPGDPPYEPTEHWALIDEFTHGDIKCVWELARFGFVYALARAYARSGSDRYPRTFWHLVENWRENNPPNRGPHWKCGQEIAFRIMAWCFGLFTFLDSSETTPERKAMLTDMIAVSARRVRGNIGYALSQKNNHGISEATALWTVGILFPRLKGAGAWRDRGGELLERLGRELIYDDGSFCQHSMNYHRLVLHNYLWAAQLGRANGHRFSEELLGRIHLAGVFLQHMVDAETGYAPNIGANDGSLVLQLTDCDYRDYRPTVQAASVFSTGKKCLPDGNWDEMLLWLGLREKTGREQTTPDNGLAAGTVKDFPNGGYLVVSGKDSKAVVRCAGTFRHRPSHADQLHLDLWWRGRNILPDAGTYSYNSQPWDSYFPGTSAHNTVEFDGRDQMPRISRFLFVSWLTVRSRKRLGNDADAVEWVGTYTDAHGCTHERRIFLNVASDIWAVRDAVSGFREKAVIRWRLSPDFDWKLRGPTCMCDVAEIRADAPEQPAVELVTGKESLYYCEMRDIPVLEITLRPGCTVVTTTISFQPQP